MKCKNIYKAKILFSIMAILLCSISVLSKSIDTRRNDVNYLAQDLPKVVTDTLKSYDGKILVSKFNNITGVFKFKLDGKTIFMKQIRSGSGVRAKNSRYEYTNWQGQTILKENNKVIFQTRL